MNLKLIKLAVVLAMTLVLVGCTVEQSEPTNNNSNTQGADFQPPSNPNAPSNPDDSNSAVTDYVMELSSFKFSPNVIQAEAGETIRIKLTVRDGSHDFVIDELNVASSILVAGQEQTIEFTVPQNAAGQSFEFYCSVSNHRQLGMVGTLTVVSN